ncbi:HAD family phosphatase [Kocuria sp. JC486]|uniref:HAD family phosphatase n=1 Tax=Kocuria soli TaxID=2485125 RepID=A0A3N4A0M6_9MICC|nr:MULTISPECIES: HAD family phosphatase [Kocuria]NHU85065.1 HAD family phosphatase [Kocuria sp. JC486]ROZ65654.1 HAD family phosphatase [Kocuria soli]
MSEPTAADPVTAGSPRPRPLTAEFRPVAVIFDCDGVLLDTETAWGEVQAEVFRRHDLAYGPAEERGLKGWSARAVAEEVVRRCGEAHPAADTSAAKRDVQHGITIEEALAEIIDVEARLLTGNMPVIDGALELVRRIADHVPVAVASNSTASILQTKMTTSGIADHVQTWVSSDDVAVGKPAPDIYLEAAARLGVDPTECLAVEDSPAGATAALDAGMITLGISWDGEPVPSSLLLDSVTDPRLDELLTAWRW